MKRALYCAVILVALILGTLTLQSCVIPYHHWDGYYWDYDRDDYYWHGDFDGPRYHDWDRDFDDMGRRGPRGHRR